MENEVGCMVLAMTVHGSGRELSIGQALVQTVISPKTIMVWNDILVRHSWSPEDMFHECCLSPTV